MTQTHDRAIGGKPWQVVPTRETESYTKDNPYIEGGVQYWTEGGYPDEVTIISVGPAGEYVVQKGHWYPDAIHAQEQEMLRPVAQ